MRSKMKILCKKRLKMKIENENSKWKFIFENENQNFIQKFFWFSKFFNKICRIFSWNFDFIRFFQEKR